MAEERSVKDVLKDEIFSERTQRYKRNILILSLMILVIQIGGDYIDFTGLKLFGIGLADDALKKGIAEKKIVLTTLWVIYIYNIAYFLYLAWWDYRTWNTNLFAFRRIPGTNMIRDYFPIPAMYQADQLSENDLPVNDADFMGQYSNFTRNQSFDRVRWDRTIVDTLIKWEISFISQSQGNMARTISYTLPKETINRKLEKIKFLRLEMLIVTASFAACLITLTLHY